jgi:hypothetical protein
MFALARRSTDDPGGRNLLPLQMKDSPNCKTLSLGHAVARLCTDTLQVWATTDSDGSAQLQE